MVRLVIIYALVATAAAQNYGSQRLQSLERSKALERLGRKMFFDRSLSSSGRLSCASCHDPAFAYGPPNGLAVQLGGTRGRESGIRAVPSLRYLQAVPQFTEHSFEEETNGDDSVDNGPTGGLTWDGRVDRGRQQARIPLLSRYEMANQNEMAVVAAARKASYASDLERLCSNTDEKAMFETILEAFEAWEQNYQEFYPYSSKYDAWLAGQAQLTEREQRGLRIFSDAKRGNCTRCHIADKGSNGTPPQFTDYSLVALGVRRNSAIPANGDPNWYDLGMCGPMRTDFLGRDEYCGRFMTPSLRNVAMRQVFFHNGVIHSLREAVAFYVKRDKDPDKFDDLPVRYRKNVETEAPFGQRAGSPPVLTDEDIDDIVAFLKTLSDGYGTR